MYPYRIPLLRRVLSLGRVFLGRGIPLQVLLFEDAGLSKLVSEIVEIQGIDVVNGFLIRSFLAVQDQPRPLVMDFVDSMLLNVRTRLSNDRFWMRPVLALEARLLGGFEKRVCVRAAASIVVADADQCAVGGPRMFVVPIGVDAAEFHPPAQGGQRVHHRVVFSGNMGYHANRTALAWFLGRCWPHVFREFPNAEMCVVGSGTETLAAAYRRVAGLRLVGRVASMGDFLRTADVSVAPMQSGSGMQNKILEAMACGTPTVVTKLGLGGIAASSGEHLLVANTEREFVEAIRTLFTDEALRRSLSSAGAAFVASRYTCSRNASEFERVLGDCLSADSAIPGRARAS
jgi:glycosyltransferase involved in cell wall biosynthesis